MNDDRLWEAFSTRTLPADLWTHRTHIRVAWLHARRWPLAEAHLRMRVGIIRLNAAHGLEETPQRGYHERLTHFWLSAVAATLARDAREASSRVETDSDAFCSTHPELLDKSWPLLFFSRERLFSLAARAVLLEPDLHPLPD
jgi:hypothetical protein